MKRKLFLAFCWLLSALLAVGGYFFWCWLAPLVKLEMTPSLWWAFAVLAILLFGVLGMLFFPWFFTALNRIANRMVAYFYKIPIWDLLISVGGLILGLIVGNLLGLALRNIWVVGPYLWIVSALVFAYVGLELFYRKREELAQLFHVRKGAGKGAPCKILDTSAIIDGRIIDACLAGFVEGTLLVPEFVLTELRHIADSDDSLKRARGRRGLDMLSRISADEQLRLEVTDQDYPDLPEVDDKLLRLATERGGVVVSTDYNLSQMAKVCGVRCLNMNELADVMKVLLLPGETLRVQLVKSGKEPGQGVAYLDDGTMVVVENGRSLLGQEATVQVTSALQTAAGKMIFAKLAES